MKISNKLLFVVITLSISLIALSFYYFKNNSKTSVIISDKIIDLGEIKIGLQKKAVFKMKNIGNNDLQIHEVIPDCYCTVPSWEKDPISPQDFTNITIIVNKEYEGIFQQIVTVVCNTQESRHLLVVRGKFIK